MSLNRFQALLYPKSPQPSQSYKQKEASKHLSQDSASEGRITMGTFGEEDKREMIKCLLCQGDVEEAEMIDHIASKHMGYTLHKCEGCDFGCHDAERALRHALETRHPVMLNKVGPDIMVFGGSFDPSIDT